MISEKVKGILEVIEQRIVQMGINPGRKKWRYLVVAEAEKHSFDLKELRELLGAVNISYINPPLFASNWAPSICKKFMSLKYTNPNDDREFVHMVSSNSIFGVAGTIHHTPERIQRSDLV